MTGYELAEMVVKDINSPKAIYSIHQSFVWGKSCVNEGLRKIYIEAVEWFDKNYCLLCKCKYEDCEHNSGDF